MKASWMWLVILAAALALANGCQNSVTYTRGGPTWTPGDFDLHSDKTPPVVGGAGISPSIAAPVTGQAVTFSVAATDDRGGILTYTWSDGNAAAGTFAGEGASVTWASVAAGTFTITVTVTDAAGNSTTATYEITVATAPHVNSPPAFPDNAAIGLDLGNPYVGQIVNFATLLATDADGDALTYSFNDEAGYGSFGDVTIDAANNLATASWTPPLTGDPGTYAFTGSVSDGTDTAELSTQFSTRALPTPGYLGAQVCGTCHSEKYNDYILTKHAVAAAALTNAGQPDRGVACWTCHSIGYGGAGDPGYIDSRVTPQFSNVQCENCHGSGVGHPASGPLPVDWDPANTCGKCHAAAANSHNPAYEEWAASVHGTFDATAPEAVGANCVKCHNGQYFVSIQLDGDPPPAADLAEGYHIVCATCHDPHNSDYKAQLRVDPAADTTLPMDDFVIAGAGTGNTCMMCHNGRDAAAGRDDEIANGNADFGYHGNCQPNMLFGVGAIEFAGYDWAGEKDPLHNGVTDLCVCCHQQKHAYVSATDPAATGHNWVPAIAKCKDCHGASFDDAAVTAFQDGIETKLQAFEAAWPWQTPDPGGGRPILLNLPADTADACTPAYREALWNYDFVLNDKSRGVHNPGFADMLLDSAIAKLTELNAGP